MKKIIMLLGILLICVGCGSPIAEQYRRQQQEIKEAGCNAVHEASYIKEVNECQSEEELDQYISQINWYGGDFTYYPEKLFSACDAKREDLRKTKITEVIDVISEDVLTVAEVIKPKVLITQVEEVKAQEIKKNEPEKKQFDITKGYWVFTPSPNWGEETFRFFKDGTVLRHGRYKEQDETMTVYQWGPKDNQTIRWADWDINREPKEFQAIVLWSDLHTFNGEVSKFNYVVTPEELISHIPSGNGGCRIYYPIIDPLSVASSINYRSKFLSTFK